MSKFEHKDKWVMSGNNFAVEVYRHGVEPRDGEGPNRWAVYAYIYPQHQHFDKFEGNAMYQDAASVMPFHGGPSYLQWYFNSDREPCSVKVGADYHHLYDDFTHYATKDDAWVVFKDAEELHEWLTVRARI